MRRRTRPGRAGLGTAAAVLVLLAGAPVSAAPAGSKERDVQLVYCLDASRRAELVTAAVRLGLLQPGASAPDSLMATDSVMPTASVGRMTPEAWSVRRQDDFARACSALMGAASDSPGAGAEEKKGEGGWWETFLTSLPLLAVGALLPLGGQAWERVSSERRLLKQQLESGRASFRAAAREYLRNYEDDPAADHAAVLTAHEALGAALARVAAPGARRTRARQLADELPLARPLPEFSGDRRLGTDARARRAQEVRQSVDRKLSAVSDLNRRTFYWRWRTARERLARTTPGATA
ncbi:hypothetical protein [Streptomyces sp. NRRL S-244]|uniref:hypothetical protein n=1 Tax=Streptomyces sp. NRRL S-244 TaxID=1463897 RepID=UPI00131A55C9|nr:hypothetical protein [Streptomyces sp. NRRL S-244]